MSDIYTKLSKQSLARPLSLEEEALATALESIYIKGIHDPLKVCEALGGAYTPESLESALKTINASLDQAYQELGIGA